MSLAGDRAQYFLNQFGAGEGNSSGFQRSDQDLLANLIKLRRSDYPAGTGPNTIPRFDSGSGGAGSYKNPRGSYQYMDDEFPNPFGGGSAPYMPGAMLPAGNNQIIANAAHPGPYPYGQPDKWDSWEKQYNLYQQDKIKRLNTEDLIGPPPNPFGGGSSPYVRGV